MPLNESQVEHDVYKLTQQVSALTRRVTSLEALVAAKRAPQAATQALDEAVPELMDVIGQYAVGDISKADMKRAVIQHDAAVMRASLRVAANRFDEGFDGDDDAAQGLRALANDIK